MKKELAYMRNTSRSHRRLGQVACSLASLIFLVLLSACGSTTTTGTSTSPTAKPKGDVSVLYAGSLVTIMEHQISPAFDKATGYTFAGEGKGSTALAVEITGHLRTPDVFISADPKVNTTLMGAANGNYVSWYMTMARTELVIGYNPNSRFAADFQAAANGSKPWYQVLEEPGVRLGRTDPELDPKGVSTILMFDLAQQYYNQPGLEQKVLGSDENASQVFPEEELIARLGAGQLDAGIFYLNEVKAAHIPYITLPDQINLGNPADASNYATVQWTDPKTSKVHKGAPIIYTITIPSTSKNMAGAIAFVNFMLSSQGQSILTADGVLSTPIKLTGAMNAVPQQLRQYIQSS
jgi:molybdate/tungstate transport system substrate-binding protein